MLITQLSEGTPEQRYVHVLDVAKKIDAAQGKPRPVIGCKAISHTPLPGKTLAGFVSAYFNPLQGLDILSVKDRDSDLVVKTQAAVFVVRWADGDKIEPNKYLDRFKSERKQVRQIADEMELGSYISDLAADGNTAVLTLVSGKYARLHVSVPVAGLTVAKLAGALGKALEATTPDDILHYWWSSAFRDQTGFDKASFLTCIQGELKPLKELADYYKNFRPSTRTGEQNA